MKIFNFPNVYLKRGLFGVLLGAICGVLYWTLNAGYYTSKITFVLASDKPSSGLANLASVLSQDGGGNGENAFAGENITLLLQSRVMIVSALTKRSSTGRRLIDEYIRSEGLDKKWEEITQRSPLKLANDPGMWTSKEDSLVTIIYEAITTNKMSIARMDKRLNFYRIEANFRSQVMAKEFLSELINVSSSFYIQTKTSIARKNLDMLKREADSLSALLSGTITTATSESDLYFNLNPAMSERRAGVQRNNLQTQVLTIAYGEVLKNLELAKVNLMKETPLYNIVDRPSKSVKYIRKKLLFVVLAGIFAGGILLVFYTLASRQLRRRSNPAQ